MNTDLLRILPETILVVAGILVMLIDAALPPRRRGRSKSDAAGASLTNALPLERQRLVPSRIIGAGDDQPLEPRPR